MTPSAGWQNDGSSCPKTGFACHRGAVGSAWACAVQELASLKSQLMRLRASLPAATLLGLGWSMAQRSTRLPLPRLFTGPDAAWQLHQPVAACSLGRSLPAALLRKFMTSVSDICRKLSSSQPFARSALLKFAPGTNLALLLRELTLVVMESSESAPSGTLVEVSPFEEDAVCGG